MAHCIFCGEYFYPNSSQQKYCSRRCTKKSYNLRVFGASSKKMTCAWCGAEFEKRSNTQKFCSKRCQTDERTQRRRELSGNVGDKVCHTCGKAFPPIIGRQKYCSDECKREMRRQKKRTYHEPLYGVCEYCGSEYQKRAVSQRFCSTLCNRRNRYWSAGQERGPKNYEAMEYVPSVVNRPTRYCASGCGTPTNNYRCSACWQEIMEKQDEILDYDPEMVV